MTDEYWVRQEGKHECGPYVLQVGRRAAPGDMGEDKTNQEQVRPVRPRCLFLLRRCGGA